MQIFESSKIWKCLFFDQNRVFEQSGALCNIENGFYWLVCFFCECLSSQRLEKCCFLNKAAHLSRQFVEAGVVSLEFYLLYQWYMLCNVENAFYWPFWLFHYEYLRGQSFENSCFLSKIACLSRSSFEICDWAVRFILFYREVLCQDSKWYLVTSLLPLEIFVSLKIRKRSYFQENSPFELRQFWKVGVV